MYKLDLEVDKKEAAAIERRRIAEQQRKSRIFNARERTIGLDVEVLEKQKNQKKTEEEEEKHRNEAFASEMKRCDMIGELLQQRQTKDAREKNKLLVGFRKDNQRIQDRREYDLYDPDTKKKELPPRVSDDDPRLTVSGMQLFNGEDLTYEQRKRVQQKQLKDWTIQQAEEKYRHEMEEKYADRLYHLKAREMDQRAVELEEADQQARRALTTAIKDYNCALANEKAAQEKQDFMQEQDDNFTELTNQVNGDMLTENPEVAKSAFGEHRVVPDRWKGMTPQQIQEIRETQEKQRQEKEDILRQEKSLSSEWDRQRVADARAGLVLESRIMKKERQLKQKLAEENKQLAGEQRHYQNYLNKELYTNPLAPSYFTQFNTTSR